MKKTLSKVLSLVLCFSVVFSYSFYAFADEVAVTASNDQTVADQVTDLDATPSQDDAEVVTDVVNDEAAPADEADDESDNQTKDEADKTDDSSVDPVDDETESEPEPQDLTVTADDDAVITIRAPAGALPEGATVKAETIGFFGKIGMKNAIEEAVEANDAELVSFKAYDITIYDGDEVVQPEGDVTVSIKGTGLESEGNVYHVSDDNSVVEPVEGTADDDEAEFTTDHFSIYVVTEENGPALATYTFKNGDDTVSTQIVKNGESLVKPAAPKKDGYKFIGWFNGETEFTSFDSVSVTAKEDVTLTAKFAEAHYVYFMDRNRTDVAVTKEGVEGSTISTTDVVLGTVGADEAITGWYYDSALTEPADTITLETENVKVYPKVESGHWITFKTDGGTYITPRFYTANANTVAPENPTRDGYTFKGWKNGKSDFAFGSKLTTNVDLTAVWEAADANYTVIYWLENADDDNYSYKESSSEVGKTGTNAIYYEESYDGFTFKNADNKTIAGNGSTIVNVYYSRNEYTVTWGNSTSQLVCGINSNHKHNNWIGYNGCYKRGELTCTNTKKSHRHTDSCYEKKLDCNLHVHDTSCYKTVYPHSVTAKYGAYIGDKWPGGSWYISNGSTEGQTWLEYMPLGGKAYGSQQSAPGGNIGTYYVESVDGLSVVEHHKDNVNGSFEVSEADGKKYYITGFTYVDELNIGGNNYKSTQIGSSYTGAKFYYSRNAYEVEYYNNNSLDETKPFKYEANLSDGNYVPECNQEGYTFVGWYDNELCEGEPFDFSENTMPAHDILLYAKWEAPSFTVTAYAPSEGTEIPVAYGAKVDHTKLPECNVEGKTFSGWATMDSNGNLIPFNLNTEIYSDVELYPIYTTSGESYTVTYMSTGATDVKDDNKYLVDSKAAIKQNMFTPAKGKVFLGWTGSDGKTYQPGDKITVTGDMTLTAIWGDEPGTVSVTFNANGGTGTDVVVTGINNGTITSKTAAECRFSRTGYTFVGWGTTPDATKDIFANNAEVRVNKLESNTLYAIWEANKYTVTFVDEDGTTVLKEATEYEYGTKAEDIKKPADPTKAATAENTYTFAGWTPTIDDVKGNATYKATYTATAVYTVTINYVDDTVDANVIKTAEVVTTDANGEKFVDKAAYDVTNMIPSVISVTTGEGDDAVTKNYTIDPSFTYDATGSIDAADVEITVVYSVDELEDSTVDTDPEEPGDGVPDKYQKELIFKVVNGYWSEDKDKDDIVEVITFIDADGNYVETASETEAFANVSVPAVTSSKNYPIPEKLGTYITVSASWNTEIVPVKSAASFLSVEMNPSIVVEKSTLREDGLYVFTYTYVDNTPQGGGTIIPPTGDDPEDKPEDKPSVDPSGDGEDIPSDKPDVDPNGGSDVIDDGIDGDAMGGDKPITDTTEATPNGVKTGDETNVGPWAAGFGFAILGLGAAVALRRKEDEN